MDIRDVVKEGIVYPDNLFEDMFRLQKKLIDHYVGIEGLPPYPLDINTKKSQHLIKDFSARIIEELGEGFESMLVLVQLFNEGKSKDVMIPHLQNMNEELSDAIHFWLELMIYSGFEIDHLKSWGNPEDYEVKGCVLSKWLKLGSMNNDLRFFLEKPKGFEIIKEEDLNGREYLRGGRKISRDIVNKTSLLLWDITYHQQILRNTLKNKPWKQTGVLTDTGQYEKAMTKTCLSIFSLLDFLGFTPESVYAIYFYKNKINQFRIKSQY